MSDLLGLAFDAAVFGIGLLTIGSTLWRASASRQRAGMAPMEQRAARAWKWRIAFGLGGGSVGICFGGYLLLRDVGVGGFDWLVVLGIFGAVGFLVALYMLADLGAFR